jgi:hypothetical protein
MRIPNNWCWSVGAKLKGGDRITERTLGIAHGAAPDGDDAATRGCLLEQVRDRWQDPRAFVVPMWKRWRATVHTAAGKRYYVGPTEWDALSFALDGSGDVAQTDMLPDWKTRALAAEAKIAAATERATALSRAGLGTVEPWAQAGQVLREIAGQMLACLRGEDVPPLVLIPADDWVPVTERLPEDNTAVEAFTTDNTVTTMWMERGRMEDESGVEFAAGFITHWRHIVPPVVSKNGKE